jgi:hypothetical protein
MIERRIDACITPSVDREAAKSIHRPDTRHM